MSPISKMDCHPKEHSDEGPRGGFSQPPGWELSRKEFALLRTLLRFADARWPTAVRKKILSGLSQGLRPGLPSAAPFGGLHLRIPFMFRLHQRANLPCFLTPRLHA